MPAKPARPGRGSAGHALIELQRAAGNRAVGQIVSRQTAEPQVRDALLAQASSLIRAALSMIPGMLPLAARILGEGTPGGSADARAAAGTLYGQLMAAGNMLDSGIQLLQQGGGRLADVEHLLKARAHLSAAAHFTQLAMGGAGAAMAPMVIRHLNAALVERGLYEAEEAIRAATAHTAEAGPQTPEQSIREQAQEQVLRARYLAPFGASPNIGL